MDNSQNTQPPQQQEQPKFPEQASMPPMPKKIGMDEPKPKKQGNFLVTFLSILLLLAVGAAGFFAYQTQNLVKQINELKMQPTATPEASPTSTPDPTADWETYSGSLRMYPNNIYEGYKFKYPGLCTVNKEVLECNTQSGSVNITVDTGGHGVPEIEVIKQDEIKSYSFGGVKESLWKVVEDGSLGGVYWIYKTDELEKDSIFGFEIFSDSTDTVDDTEKLMDQIFSTFEFVEKESATPEASASATPAN